MAKTRYGWANVVVLTDNVSTIRLRVPVTAQCRMRVQRSHMRVVAVIVGAGIVNCLENWFHVTYMGVERERPGGVIVFWFNKFNNFQNVSMFGFVTNIWFRTRMSFFVWAARHCGTFTTRQAWLWLCCTSDSYV